MIRDLSSRRRFLARAATGLAGGLAAASAVGGVALAAGLPADSPAKLSGLPADDPIIALAERFLEADRESSAANLAEDEFAPMREWKEKNPRPVLGKTPVRDNVALTLDGTARYINTLSGEALTEAEAWPGFAEAEAEHREALRKWNRRRQAAERRTGYRKLEQANDEASRRLREAEDALWDALPLNWEGLAAKARAFRKTYGQEQRELMGALMLDIAILSGEIDRASGPLLSEEELANG